MDSSNNFLASSSGQKSEKDTGNDATNNSATLASTKRPSIDSISDEKLMEILSN